MFHWKDGWFFTRLQNGDVEITKRETTHVGSPVLQAVIIPALEWCSILASVTRGGETSVSFAAARELHIPPEAQGFTTPGRG